MVPDARGGAPAFGTSKGLNSDHVAAWRMPGLQLAYTTRLTDSRRPIRDPDPDATFIVYVSPTMRAAMHPFDTLVI